METSTQLASLYRQTISDIKQNQTFKGWLLVREAGIRTTTTGRRFLDLRFTDKTGSIPAKVWEFSGDLPRVGDILWVEGQGNEFNGHLQLKVSFMRPAAEEDQLDPASVIPSAPENPDTMLARVMQTAQDIRDDALRAVTLWLLHQANRDGRLRVAPAAKSMHHAERGGLLHHTCDILRAAEGLCAVYPMLDKDLLYAGVIVHDLGKLDEMMTDEVGLVSEYSRDGRLIGHIARGVANIEIAGMATHASREKVTLLQHLVLSHHGDAEFGSPVPPKVPEALVLSTLDRLDARMFEMAAALQGVPEGSFSAPVFALDRAEIYRPSGNPGTSCETPAPAETPENEPEATETKTEPNV